MKFPAQLPNRILEHFEYSLIFEASASRKVLLKDCLAWQYAWYLALVFILKQHVLEGCAVSLNPSDRQNAYLLNGAIFVILWYPPK